MSLEDRYKNIKLIINITNGDYFIKYSLGDPEDFLGIADSIHISSLKKLLKD